MGNSQHVVWAVGMGPEAGRVGEGRGEMRSGQREETGGGKSPQKHRGEGHQKEKARCAGENDKRTAERKPAHQRTNDRQTRRTERNLFIRVQYIQRQIERPDAASGLTASQIYQKARLYP